jgi:zeaxanthin glucosyltransferase
MPRLVFLLYHGTGHFNACLRMARILQQHYEVIFSGHVFFQHHAKFQNLPYYALNSVPFGLGFENWVNTSDGKKNIYWHSLKDRWNNRLYNLRETELAKMIEDTKADYLLIDSWQSTDFIVLYPFLKANKIKIGFIQTMLPTITSRDIPPLNTLALPDNPSAIRKAHRLLYWQQLKRSLLQKIKYFGKDDTHIVKTMLDVNGIPSTCVSKTRALVTCSFEQIPEFVLAPKEFDFVSSYPSQHRHYVGFMPDFDRSEIIDTSFVAVQNQITKRLGATGVCFLYCSFGSIEHDNLKPMLKFIERLVNIARVTKHVLLVSINSQVVIDHFNALPSSVFILKNVPQLHVLSRANVFITHGGLNSIKEAIYAGVPMLVYPSNSTTDQNGNSSRVVFHKLGLRGNIREDTEKEITEKIDVLLTDKMFIENIKRVKEVDQTYSAQNILHIIGEISSI